MPHSSSNISSINRIHESHGSTRMTVSRLRLLTPTGYVTFSDSLRLARRQAVLLLTGRDISAAVPLDVITNLPHLRIEFVADQWLPSAAFWDTSTRQWIIQVPGSNPFKHQRVAVARELKHILDYHHATTLYQDDPAISGRRQAEQAADHFAANLLVPSQSLRRAWKAGVTGMTELSDYFCVPKAVVRQRLQDLRLGRYASRTFYHLTTSATKQEKSAA